MKAFRLFSVIISAATFAVACQPGPSGHSDIGGTDTAETDTDTDSDADSDADSDSDTDADSDGPFAAVAGEWCVKGSEACDMLDDYGYIMPGLGPLEAVTLDGQFPILFRIPEVDGEGEFTNAINAKVTIQGTVIDYESVD